MRGLAFTVTLLLAAPSFAGEKGFIDDFTFRGHRMGDALVKHRDAYRNRALKTVEPCSSSFPGFVSCIDGSQFGTGSDGLRTEFMIEDVRVRRLSYLYLDGKLFLIQLWIYPEQWRLLHDLWFARYGQPFVEERGRTLWKFSGGSMELGSEGVSISDDAMLAEANRLLNVVLH